MFGALKKVVQTVKSAVGCVKKKTVALFATLGALFVSSEASAASSDIVTYASDTGITWDFSSVLTMIFAAVSAAMAAGVLVWVAIKGYQLMKRFLSGR